MHNQHFADFGRHRNRLEVAQRIKAGARIQKRIHYHHGLDRQIQRVPVGWRFSDQRRRDIAACPRTVIDNEGLAQHFSNPGEGYPSDGIRQRARRGHGHHTHGF